MALTASALVRTPPSSADPEAPRRVPHRRHIRERGGEGAGDHVKQRPRATCSAKRSAPAVRRFNQVRVRAAPRGNPRQCDAGLVYQLEGIFMFLHNKRMMYAVRVDQPNPAFSKMLLEQFGGPNGELAAAMRYFTQGWNEPDAKRRSMLLDIATEELSHLEMVAQSLVMLFKGSPSELVDQVEGNYLGDLLDGKHEDYVDLSLNSSPNILGGDGPRLTDSMGTPWTAAYIDTLGQPAADLRSDIAAEARAKIVYERLIKCTDDAGMKDTLNFLMTRELPTRRCSRQHWPRSRRTSRPARCPATKSSDTPTSLTPETSERRRTAGPPPRGLNSRRTTTRGVLS
jgi:rubrerythrin